MYGGVLVAISLVFANSVLYSIGLGLLVDEATYLLIRGKTHEDNYSVRSLVGTAVLVLLVYIFREELSRGINLVSWLFRTLSAFWF